MDAVVEAGSRILCEGGWAALSMKALAARAGVSPGSLYQYFPDKASFMAHLIEAQSRRELAVHLARFERIPPDASLEHKLVAVVDGVLAFQRAEGPLMKATLESLAHIGRYELLASRAAAAAAALRALLEPHRAELAVRDLDLATHVLANAIHSLTHDGVLRRPADLDDDALSLEIVRLAMGYLRTTVVR